MVMVVARGMNLLDDKELSLPNGGGSDGSIRFGLCVCVR